VESVPLDHGIAASCEPERLNNPTTAELTAKDGSKHHKT
jgi:hypothetical protein